MSSKKCVKPKINKSCQANSCQVKKKCFFIILCIRIPNLPYRSKGKRGKGKRGDGGRGYKRIVFSMSI